MRKQGNVLIAGATGLVGKHCLEALLELNAHENIHLLLRRPLDNHDYPSHVHSHVIDFENMDKYAELFREMDQVICCLGTTLKQAGSISAFQKVDYDYCYQLACLAKDAGVPHFLIVTAVNANAGSLAYYSKTKGRLQVELGKLGFKRLSIFQPSLLLGEREQFRFGEGVFGRLSVAMNALLPRKMSAYKAIEGKVVGEAMAKLAADEKLTKDNGAQYYQYEQIQALSQADI